MKYLSIIIALLISGCTNINNNQACEKFESYLFRIQIYIQGKHADSSISVGQTVQNLENITFIQSEGFHDWVGCSNPSINDFFNWFEWFIKNKKYLRYNKELDKVYIENDSINKSRDLGPPVFELK